MSQEDGSKKDNSHNTAIIVAMIGLVGVLGAALIARWPEPAPPGPNGPTGSTGGGGTLEDPGSPQDPTPPSDPHEEVVAFHKKRLELFLSGDATGYAATLSPMLVDMGGGRNGDGSMSRDFMSVSFWRKHFESPHFAKVRGKRADDVVDFELSTVDTLLDAYSKRGRTLKPWLQPLRSDLIVATPARPGSPLRDGWMGVYRKVNGFWKTVALD